MHYLLVYEDTSNNSGVERVVRDRLLVHRLRCRPRLCLVRLHSIRHPSSPTTTPGARHPWTPADVHETLSLAHRPGIWPTGVIDAWPAGTTHRSFRFTDRDHVTSEDREIRDERMAAAFQFFHAGYQHKIHLQYFNYLLLYIYHSNYCTTFLLS